MTGMSMKPDYPKVLELFEEMKEYHVEPKHSTYGHALLAGVKLDNVDFVKKLKEEMIQKVPHQYSFLCSQCV